MEYWSLELKKLKIHPKLKGQVAVVTGGLEVSVMLQHKNLKRRSR